MTLQSPDAFIEEFADYLNSGALGPFATNPVIGEGAIPFPDANEPIERQLGFVLLYLLDHAGLGELDLRLEAWTLDPVEMIPQDQPYEPTDSFTLLAYAGTEDGVCQIVYDPQKIDEPIRFLGAAALVIAEVHRDLRPRAGDPFEGASEAAQILAAEFEGLVLGFGVLLANASLHITARQTAPDGVSAAHIQLAQSTTTTQGVLGPERLGYLCALQMRLRQASAERIAKVRKGLLAKPRHPFNQALESIDDTTLAALGLLTQNVWPTTAPAHHSTPDMQRLQVLRTTETHLTALKRIKLQRNREGLVFRVPAKSLASPILSIAGLGIPAFAVSAIVLAPAIGFLVFAMIVVGALLFYWDTDPFYKCSNASCEARIPADATRCPECAGTIIGELSDPNQRLILEEAWREQHYGGADNIEPIRIETPWEDQVMVREDKPEHEADAPTPGAW